MDSTSLIVAATAIGALAFFARTAVLLGREPGGVDSWYYLCYARAFRKAPGLKVGLPQYLLQDQQQSYAPIFPSLLALIPEKVLARIFWAISPGIDCLTLILLFLLASAKEHYEHSGDPKDAMVGSLAHSGRVIFAAGAVMVAVFFTFALSGPLPPKEMGIVLGVAVLLDAFLVRLVLLPVLLRLTGKAAWCRISQGPPMRKTTNSTAMACNTPK